MNTQNLHIKQFKKTLTFLGVNIFVLICIQGVWRVHEQNHEVYTHINTVAEKQRVSCQMISQELLFLHQYPDPIKLDTLKADIISASNEIEVLQAELEEIERDFILFKHTDVEVIHRAFLNVDKHSYQIAHIAKQVLYFIESDLDQSRQQVINRYFHQLEKHEFAYLKAMGAVFKLLDKANTRFHNYTALYEAISFCISLGVFILIVIAFLQLRKQKLINEMLPSQFIDQNSSDVVFICDKHTKIVWANNRFKAFTEKSAYEIKHYKLWHLLPNDLAFNQAVEDLKVAWANKKRHTSIITLEDGVTLQIQMRPVLDANMEIEKCIFRISDSPVTAFNESDNKHFQSILEAIPDLVFVNDAKGTFKEYYYNDSDQLFVKENFIGKNTSDILPPSISKKVLAGFQKAKKTKKVIDVEYELTTTDNQNRYFHARIVCFSTDLFLTVVRDISNTQKSKIELQKLNGRLEEIVHHKSKKYSESEEKFKLLFESASDGILLLDKDFNIAEINQKALSLFKFDSKIDLIGKNLLLFSPEVQAENNTSQSLLNQYFKEVTKQKSVSFNWKFGSNSSKGFTAEVAMNLLDMQGQHMILANIRDITKRFENELMLKTSEEKFRLLTENTGDLVVLFDQEGNCTYVSPSCAEMLGYSTSELMGKDMLHLMHPDDFEHAQTTHQRLLKEQKVTDFKFRNIHKNGSVIWFNSTLNLVQNRNKTFVIVVSRNITEQVKTEEKLKLSQQRLRESEERYRLLADNTSDVVIMSYEPDVISFVTPSIKGLLNYSPEKIYHLKSPRHIVYAEDLPLAYDLAKKTFRTMQPHTFECRLVNSENKTVWVEIIVSPVFNLTKVTGTLYSIRNIEERKKAEDNIMKALEREKQVSELQKRFISIASHEFRTPLTTISSSVGILSLFINKVPDDLIPKFNKHLDRIANAGDRLVSLMNDILLIGRIEADRTPFTPTKNNPVEFIENLIHQSFTSPTEGDKIKLNTDGDTKNVAFDTNLMTHVFNNLISNAIKYSPKDTPPELNIHFSPDMLEFNVVDKGIGIPKEDQANLFQSFFRASNVGNIEGTGLGLVIAREFVQMHNGELTFESAVNEGTCFTVKLPLLQDLPATQN
ncbi:sensor histidine kinase [Sediminitomix flava]|uniref:histidine kinase n=1 Tax=Sediminitomix flava TaxID=379075 RepID=A0A315Z8U9_SEDFL|nr:PAS domain S-box protein [Sediminitomix flava]PWJ40985.1 PAS domain S-box-containing protein [Sediminitomix flava]